MSSEIRDRIERAKSEQMSHEIIDEAPMIVAVDNESSGSTHAVIPVLGHCSCEDHMYRDVPCKHQVFLAMQDDRAAETMRQYFTDELKGLQDRETELRAELREIESERKDIEAVRSELEPVLDYSEGGSVGDDEEYLVDLEDDDDDGDDRSKVESALDRLRGD